MEQVVKEMLINLKGLDLGMLEYSKRARCLVNTFMADASAEEVGLKYYEIMGEKL